jgi:hypothetical protein
MPELAVIEPEGVSPDLIETIEQLLEKAKAGEISSVAVAFVYRDGTIGRDWSTPPSFAALLGAVTRLAHRMNIVKDEE